MAVSRLSWDFDTSERTLLGYKCLGPGQDTPRFPTMVYIDYFELKLLKKTVYAPCLVWLSGLSANLLTKGSLVQFPVRAHAWVAGQVPSWGCVRGNQSIYLSHIVVSLPFSFPSLLFKNK